VPARPVQRAHDAGRTATGGALAKPTAYKKEGATLVRSRPSLDISHYSFMIERFERRIICTFGGAASRGVWRREAAGTFPGCGGSEESISVSLGWCRGAVTERLQNYRARQAKQKHASGRSSRHALGRNKPERYESSGSKAGRGDHQI
jgi:hypothetical protein